MTALRYRSQHVIDRSSEDQLDDLLLYLDSDEEMENDDKEKMDKTESSPAIEQSEHWNLVDVMPSFHRGNEAESVFQQAATSFIPGVMSVMESLNQHDRPGFLSRGKRYLR